MKSVIYTIMLTLNVNFYIVLIYDARLTLQQFIKSILQFIILFDRYQLLQLCC
jgi:hypothetical protein